MARRVENAMTATLATGRPDRPSNGFTLVELLTAVVILGLCGAMAVLAMPESRPSLGAQAAALAGAVAQGRDEAVLTNRPARLAIDASGYSIRLGDGESPALVQGQWIAGDQVVITGADGVALPSATLNLDSTGVADPATVRLARADQRLVVRIDQSAQVSVDAAP
jgi:general secretion pathway protein H